MSNSADTPKNQPAARQPVLRCKDPPMTRCKRGHDLTQPNALYIIPSSGKRLCRACKSQDARSSGKVLQATHLKRAAQGQSQNPLAVYTEKEYTPPPMKSWPLTSCNEIPLGLTPYRAMNPGGYRP